MKRLIAAIRRLFRPTTYWRVEFWGKRRDGTVFVFDDNLPGKTITDAALAALHAARPTSQYEKLFVRVHDPEQGGSIDSLRVEINDA